MSGLDTKKCLICKEGKHNDCLYWHEDKDSGSVWVYCSGKCQRGYSLYGYCSKAGIPLIDFLQNDFNFEESRPNEVQRMEWPAWFLPLHDKRSQSGIEYVRSRGLEPVGDMFYDADSKGIVFPYYFHSTFVGAQIRLIVPRSSVDGEEPQKMDTLPGTRLGLLFYNFDQSKLMGNVKGLIVTEGAFNALSIQQSLNEMYGSRQNNPWHTMATSGCGLSDHQVETLAEYKAAGYKVVLAPDSDDAGMKMLRKAIDKNCLTHYSLTDYTDVDWNDVLREYGRTGLAQFFMKGIKLVTQG